MKMFVAKKPKTIKDVFLKGGQAQQHVEVAYIVGAFVESTSSKKIDFAKLQGCCEGINGAKILIGYNLTMKIGRSFSTI